MTDQRTDLVKDRQSGLSFAILFVLTVPVMVAETFSGYVPVSRPIREIIRELIDGGVARALHVEGRLIIAIGF
ncbi:hypothetical protein GWI33_004912 [Rhynchophorus ferrugineus]|uniref:Uncharacterized protein n=1 Tax=Rhynchophorus ferrugineus TaxID=354439 RepID=A0A834ME92_RHYFE|nr:hypothetical protein GWI33_004912 [Rhynchophorus ferrugineus]